MERGKLLVISGPSGVGKSTAIHGLLKKHPEMYFSVSATTRQKRPTDTEGVTYLFKTRLEFAEMVAENAFYEHAEYAGNCYGTPRKPVDDHLDAGKDVVLDIDVQGALQIQERCPDAVLVFLAAPSFQELEARLQGRGDTSREDMEKRLQKARWEYAQAHHYDYIVVSDTPDRVVENFDHILAAEKLRAGRGMKYVELEESL